MLARAWPAALCVAASIGVALGAAAQDAYVDDGSSVGPRFVRVVGDRFYRDHAFRFAGANVAVMHGEAHRAALRTTLDAVRDDGLQVVRLWALGERDASSPDWGRSYAFRIGEDGWIEESFVHLDHVLAEAAARNLLVIVVLANRWADYGGIPQYLRWSGDPFDATSTDGVARAELGTFFGSARAQMLYRAHVDRVVGRVNTLTGIAYRDDPTILAWELVNEISAERRDAGALGSFVAQTSRHIRSLDPNHLVSAGHIGYVTASERRTWHEIMALPEVDFADAHAYPAEHDRVRTMAELDAFVDDHARLAHRDLHKPLVLGELGFSSARRALRGARAALFDHFLARADRDGVDGVLAWIYAPSSDHAGAHTILADQPDADSRRVRAVLRDRGRAIQQAILAPSWGEGEAPLWDPSRTIPGTRRPARPDGEGRIAIEPSAFAEARFETVGAYGGTAIAHVYGGGHGYVAYRFRAPRTLGASLTVAMRASSELPGRGQGARPEDTSHVRVAIDDHEIGAIDVPPDDGIGRRVSLEVPIDEALAALLRETPVHTLRFEIDDDDAAHGLCLYGDATGIGELDPTVAAELPGRVEIVFGP